MARVLNKLNVRTVKSDLPAGKYGDGGGLSLVVQTSGSKSWVLRTTVQRKRRDIGLGGYPTVSLAEAREKRDSFVKIARSGGDPLAERRKRLIIPTFAEAVEQVIAERQTTWRNAKHAQQWQNTLEQYCYPFFGDQKVHEIDGALVRRCLNKIWTTKHETATRVFQRCNTVFDWAIGNGFRKEANPCVGIKDTLPRVQMRVKHHAAMPWRDIPQFFATLHELGSISARALQMTILTVSRTNEVRFAKWSELQNGVWTVPAERMKMGIEHRIPITTQMKELFKYVDGLDECMVFPGQRKGRPLSNMTMLKLLKSRSENHFTVHGFRSAFRDWVDEYLSGDASVAEACLAHAKGDAVVKAYARSDLFERRRMMLESWNDFVSQKSE